MAQPFSIHIDKAVLADLRQRIAATRWPDQIDGANWDYGGPDLSAQPSETGIDVVS